MGCLEGWHVIGQTSQSVITPGLNELVVRYQNAAGVIATHADNSFAAVLAIGKLCSSSDARLAFREYCCHCRNSGDGRVRIKHKRYARDRQVKCRGSAREREPVPVGIPTCFVKVNRQHGMPLASPCEPCSMSCERRPKAGGGQEHIHHGN